MALAGIEPATSQKPTFLSRLTIWAYIDIQLLDSDLYVQSNSNETHTLRYLPLPLSDTHIVPGSRMQEVS